MRPIDDDIYFENGRNHTCSSKSKYRLKPTPETITVSKSRNYFPQGSYKRISS
jgi:hypothetical protein